MEQKYDAIAFLVTEQTQLHHFPKASWPAPRSPELETCWNYNHEHLRAEAQTTDDPVIVQHMRERCGTALQKRHLNGVFTSVNSYKTQRNNLEPTSPSSWHGDRTCLGGGDQTL